MLEEILQGISHNLFKPLLLFFYAGIIISVLRVKFEFPKAVYQALTIYLLLAIGWHGGEELACVESGMLGEALGFMGVGLIANTIIAITTYGVLRVMTRLRKVDAATVAGYYGSDSAGTFVTCLGVLAAAGIAFAPYMPVMLAVMEIPGCLVALVLVARLRQRGMDASGNMPDEAGYCLAQPVVVAEPVAVACSKEQSTAAESEESPPTVYVVADELEVELLEQIGTLRQQVAGTPVRELAGVGGGGNDGHGWSSSWGDGSESFDSGGTSVQEVDDHDRPTEFSRHRLQESNDLAEESLESDADESCSSDRVAAATDSGAPRPTTEPSPSSTPAAGKRSPLLNGKLLHEVFLNPGIFLLFTGLAIGFIGRLQGAEVVSKGDSFFNTMFQGALCLFLLEMGLTAAQRIKDLKTAGWGFIVFALVAPNVFAGFGMLLAHLYSWVIGSPLDVGTYVLFAVLCGAASYIALPAVQRLAIPEASPTLPLAASLGLTFTYNVTIGIPVYLAVANLITSRWPVA